MVQYALSRVAFPLWFVLPHYAYGYIPVILTDVDSPCLGIWLTEELDPLDEWQAFFAGRNASPNHNH